VSSAESPLAAEGALVWARASAEWLRGDVLQTLVSATELDREVYRVRGALEAAARTGDPERPAPAAAPLRRRLLGADPDRRGGPGGSDRTGLVRPGIIAGLTASRLEEQAVPATQPTDSSDTRSVFGSVTTCACFTPFNHGCATMKSVSHTMFW
jgi:hypothetical protein